MIEYLVALDARVLEALYALRDPGIVQIFIWITELGSTVTIGGIALALGLLLLVRKQFSYFVGICITVAGTILAVSFLKEIIARARPDVAYQAYLESGFSFPSGHAAFSLALYGFLAVLAWRSLPSGPTRAVLTALAIAIIALVGFSRLYLGVHYASDIFWGYVVGGILLWIGISVAQRFERM